MSKIRELKKDDTLYINFIDVISLICSVKKPKYMETLFRLFI